MKTWRFHCSNDWMDCINAFALCKPVRIDSCPHKIRVKSNRNACHYRSHYNCFTLAVLLNYLVFGHMKNGSFVFANQLNHVAYVHAR